MHVFSDFLPHRRGTSLSFPNGSHSSQISNLQWLPFSSFFLLATRLLGYLPSVYPSLLPLSSKKIDLRYESGFPSSEGIQEWVVLCTPYSGLPRAALGQTGRQQTQRPGDQESQRRRFGHSYQGRRKHRTRDSGLILSESVGSCPANVNH